MQNLKNVWLDSLTSFNDVLVEIKINLGILKENANQADFMDLLTKRQYIDDISFMKQFFERAEALTRRNE
jgi:hypothetical protein|tara:strand:+ start:5784 stop:5993 length:210 start_codon:yes stop_codon:yes gene_type:complete